MANQLKTFAFASFMALAGVVIPKQLKAQQNVPNTGNDTTKTIDTVVYRGEDITIDVAGQPMTLRRDAVYGWLPRTNQDAEFLMNHANDPNLQRIGFRSYEMDEYEKRGNFDNNKYFYSNFATDLICKLEIMTAKPAPDDRNIVQKSEYYYVMKHRPGSRREDVGP